MSTPSLLKLFQNNWGDLLHELQCPAAEHCTAADPNGVGTVDRSKLKQILTAPRMGLDQRQVSRPLQAELEHALESGHC